MTDQNYTAMLMLLDRSGSMSSIREDMLGGIHELLQRQAQEEGFMTVDVLDFDDELNVQAIQVAPADLKVTLEPRGGTALYDAIGSGLNAFTQNMSQLPEHAQPAHVQVVVVTDGMENSSREYNVTTVRNLVKQKTAAGWDFVFLGANQDAVLTGASLGFEQESSLTFGTKGKDVKGANDALNRYISDKRKGEKKGFTTEERFESNDQGEA